MAYELLGDVETVVLGGINKNTGKKNPTELEGYFLRTETRPNKFNPTTPKNYYIFQTKSGEKGIYGSGGLDREMRKAKPGSMTKVINTGEKKDVGKGNPMTVFKVYQDKTNSIEVEDQQTTTESSIESASSQQDMQDWQDVDSGDEEESLFAEEEAVDEVVAPMPKRPTQPIAKAPSAERQARVQALLAKR